MKSPIIFDSQSDELRILILEDVVEDAELMEEELREGGIAFSSKRVDTEEDFVRELEDFSPQLILADYTLPFYDGSSALEMTRKHCPEVPFIFVSGTIGEQRAIETLRSGATDYMLKDRLHKLASAVKRAIQEAKERTKRKEAEDALLDQATIPEQVKVATSMVEEGVCIEVEDNGIGMDEETAGHVFEPLFTTKARGTGLGLAIVKKIVEEHGGAVSLESEPDRGTRAAVVIPVQPQSFT